MLTVVKRFFAVFELIEYLSTLHIPVLEGPGEEDLTKLSKLYVSQKGQIFGLPGETHPEDPEYISKIKMVKAVLAKRGPNGIHYADAIKKFRKAKRDIKKYGKFSKLGGKRASMLDEANQVLADRELQKYTEQQLCYRNQLRRLYREKKIKDKYMTSSQRSGSEMRLSSRDSSLESGRQSWLEPEEDFEEHDLDDMKGGDRNQPLEKRYSSHFEDWKRQGDIERTSFEEIRKLKNLSKNMGPGGISAAEAFKKFQNAEECVRKFGSIRNQLSAEMSFKLRKAYKTLERLKNYVDNQSAYRRRLTELYSAQGRKDPSGDRSYQRPGLDMRRSVRDINPQSGRQSSKEHETPGRRSRREEFESRGMRLEEREDFGINREAHFDGCRNQSDFIGGDPFEEHKREREFFRENQTGLGDGRQRIREGDRGRHNEMEFSQSNQPQRMEGSRKRPFSEEDASMREEFDNMNHQGGPSHFDDPRFLREHIVDTSQGFNDRRDTGRSLRDEVPSQNQPWREETRTMWDQMSQTTNNPSSLEQKSTRNTSRSQAWEEKRARISPSATLPRVQPGLEQAMEPSRNQDWSEFFVGKKWGEERRNTGEDSSRSTRPWDFAGMDQESNETSTWKDNFEDRSRQSEGNTREESAGGTHSWDLLRMKEKSAREPTHKAWVEGSGSTGEDFSRRIKRPMSTAISANSHQSYREESHSQTNSFDEFKHRRHNFPPSSNSVRYSNARNDRL